MEVIIHKRLRLRTDPTGRRREQVLQVETGSGKHPRSMGQEDHRALIG